VPEVDLRDPVALAQALVRCPSVTPAEAGALSLCETWLAALGFHTEPMPFGGSDRPLIANLFARTKGAGPCLAFAGHTDVVLPGARALWTEDPFAGVIRDGMLYGRGACDMKGGVAAAIAATARFLAAHPDFSGAIAFILTGDEEGPATDGTVRMVETLRARGERVDACLLAEPTNISTMGDMAKIGRRGSLSGDILVRGRQGHVAYPDRAVNPIDGLLRLVAALKATPLDAGTAHFSASNLEFTSLDVGNPARNVIPAGARAEFNIRFNDLWTSETLGAEIARRLAAVNDAPDYDLVLQPSNAEAFLTAPGQFVSQIAAAAEVETGRKPALSTTGGTSDARFIKDLCEVVEFGLVGTSMHQVNECASVADIETLTAIFERVLARFFGVN